MGLGFGEEKIQGNVVEHFTTYELKRKKKVDMQKKWIYSSERLADCFGVTRPRKALFIKKNNPILLYFRIPSSLTVSYLVLFISIPNVIKTIKIMNRFIEVSAKTPQDW